MIITEWQAEIIDDMFMYSIQNIHRQGNNLLMLKNKHHLLFMVNQTPPW